MQTTNDSTGRVIMNTTNRFHHINGLLPYKPPPWKQRLRQKLIGNLLGIIYILLLASLPSNYNKTINQHWDRDKLDRPPTPPIDRPRNTPYATPNKKLLNHTTAPKQPPPPSLPPRPPPTIYHTYHNPSTRKRPWSQSSKQFSFPSIPIPTHPLLHPHSPPTIIYSSST